MAFTITFVTNQYSCDRIICSAKEVADKTGTELVVVGILDSEYEINPEAVDYLFNLSKKNKAIMKLLFTEDKLEVMHEMIANEEAVHIVTGMPNSHQSVLYELWKKYPDKSFYVVDVSGEIVEVASSKYIPA